jgi:hypothetical protein
MSQTRGSNFQDEDGVVHSTWLTDNFDANHADCGLLCCSSVKTEEALWKRSVFGEYVDLSVLVTCMACIAARA